MDVLPVYARAGSIIPMQPLTQSTEEVPQGPLALRVYPGPNCKGSLYQDDGTSLDYQKGKYLRVNFSCEMTSEGLKIHLGATEGNYHPWWTRYEIQVVGWNSSIAHVLLNAKPDTSVDTKVGTDHVLTLNLPANGGAELQISSHP
jgi:alpha-glucosidase